MTAEKRHEPKQTSLCKTFIKRECRVGFDGYENSANRKTLHRGCNTESATSAGTLSPMVIPTEPDVYRKKRVYKETRNEKRARQLSNAPRQIFSRNCLSPEKYTEDNAG